ncbi:DinB family protein [Cyclobacterium salsum]|uniref:DinB family protein n=1 Tax=Cyclobacterium salsum TaxID=2666329 RepID=UPI001391A12B|nr:DinB family protein [Cyclobacterium salsum]
MQLDCQENLKSIASLLDKLNAEQYQFPSSYLSGASIGQHIRHILEFYTCLSQAYRDGGAVNYDKRRRAMLLEKKPAEAAKIIRQMIHWLESEKMVGPVYLVASYAVSTEQTCTIPSSFQRELAYCLEHSIHHQALIKIGLFEQGLSDLIDAHFGVAPSTIKFRMQSSPESS